MGEKTPSDRRHEKVLLLLGFVLTTVLGGVVTSYFHRQEEQRALSAQRVGEASKFVETMSRGLDLRISKWHQTAYAIEKGFSRDQIVRLYSSYAVSLMEWNQSWNWERSNLCVYFGPELTAEYERTVVIEFVNLNDSLLTRLKRDGKYRDRFAKDPLAFRMRRLAQEVYRLNGILADALRTRSLTDQSQHSCYELGPFAEFDTSATEESRFPMLADTLKKM
jgi:hypothetical protein